MLFLYGTYTNKEKKPDNVDLNIEFSVPMSYLKNWDKCSLVANFFGTYQALTYKKNKHQVISVLSTVINELLENAVKFSSDSQFEVRIKSQKINNITSIETCNIGNKKNIENLIRFTEKLETKNPELIFLKNIENNIKKNSKSELGLISIFKDYSQKIGFKIKKIPNEDDAYEIFTNIQIEDKQLST